MRHKPKACTFVFQRDRIVQVVRTGQLPVGYQMHKGDKLSGVPTAKVIPWKGIDREAFDLLLSDGRVALDIWYEVVCLA